MPDDDQWIATRVAGAHEHHQLVTEAVSARMVTLLIGELSEQRLVPSRLTELAKALIADMAPAPPKVAAMQ